MAMGLICMHYAFAQVLQNLIHWAFNICDKNRNQNRNFTIISFCPLDSFDKFFKVLNYFKDLNTRLHFIFPYDDL